MSIIHCCECDKMVDTDFEDATYANGKDLCQWCSELAYPEEGQSKEDALADKGCEELHRQRGGA